MRHEEEGEEGLDLDKGLWAGQGGASEDCLCEPEEVQGVCDG